MIWVGEAFYKTPDDFDRKPQVELVKFSHEETIERFHSLDEETTNATEEWQDIIPEANITTQIGRDQPTQNRVGREIRRCSRNAESICGSESFG